MKPVLKSKRGHEYWNSLFFNRFEYKEKKEMSARTLYNKWKLALDDDLVIFNFFRRHRFKPNEKEKQIRIRRKE